MIKKSRLLLLLLVILPAQKGFSYSFEDYLKESQEVNPSLKAAEYTEKAADLGQRQSEAISAIQLFSNASFSDDGRPVLNPNFQGERTTYFLVSAGLMQQSPWGFNWSLSQNISKTKIYGVNPGLLPLTEYYDFYPSVELSLPLWRNFLGKEVRAQKQLSKKASEIQVLQADIEKTKILIDMEQAYYCYGVQKTLLDLAQQNLQRSEKLYRSTAKRRERNLVDSSDELQTRASLSLRKLEIDKAQRDMKVCRAQFNNYLNRDDLQDMGDLNIQLIDPQLLKNMAQGIRYSKLQKLNSLQNDIQAASAVAQAESATPHLDLKGSLLFQGRDDGLSDSVDNMSEEKKNHWTVGLSFNMPLDVTLTRDLKRAANYAELAAREKNKQNVLDQKLSWIEQKEDLNRCAESLYLSRDLEKFQKQRLSAEEKKYQNGRSTLFVLLSAEQDLINAEAQKWSYELQCRIVMAKSRLFSEEI